ncbi:alpha/beta hydrolase [Bacillus cereus]|uniref:alpha/beta fold hydrolase n=1 Tax=Bacillus cereus TaxID=1396 RepID=UPI00254A0E2C|nr:alpha/beta hydrolase [Bacillus cereus]MCU5673963.1 alpha/beta hydrolase [Bacillus cereus]MDK7479473.1 alpha/beta hydrolase [Bacillus cereus]MDZ4427497.1 alpha/beta hydrolase [Bacillus cereus]
MSNEKINVHITEWGNNDKPVIFCLHGLGSTSLSFIEIAEELKEEYRFISVDAPGHGKTPPFERTEDYEMQNLANWLNEIINELRIEYFYFLSHSWGSFVALFYLLHHSEKVQGSILIDGGYQTKRLQEKTLEEEIAYYEKDFDEYVFNNWDEFFKSEKEAYTRWSSLLEVAVKDLGIEMDNKVWWHARGNTASNIIRGMYKDETIDIYEKLPANIVLLRATVPQVWADYRDKTVNVFKEKTDSIVKVIPDTTHMLHWDKPEIVIAEIKNNWS